MSIVTLTTDFGNADPYVAAMKAMILSHAPNAQLVDITHTVPAQDIVGGYLALNDVWKYFPKGTIHLGVIDPGVGTSRLPIIVEAGSHFFVGPDNGLFSFAAAEEKKSYFKIRVEAGRKDMSTTFAGRDLFAPVAGKLASSVPPTKLGERIDTIETINLPEVTKSEAGIEGQIIAIDRFGNLISNIVKEKGFDRGIVKIGDERIGKVRTCYADVRPGEVVPLWNSSDRLEIAVRNGSAEEELGLKRKAKVVLAEEKK